MINLPGEECGCDASGFYVIRYCPLHAAAPDLYEALKDLSASIYVFDYLGMDRGDKSILEKSLRKADAALALVDKETR